MYRSLSPTGVAIIGCGYWGINYVRVFNELAEAQVIAVCDARIDRLQEVEKRFPGAQFITELDRVLEMPEVEAVVICTGARTHFTVAQQCLVAGKHVLVEKPMATAMEEGEILLELAHQHHLTLMVGHTFLYNSGIRKLKTYRQQTETGPIYYLYSRRTNLGPIRHDVNAIWDLAPHDISIFNYLLDATPTWVSAVGSDIFDTGRQDVGFISLGYPDNIVGHIHVSWADPNKVRELVMVAGNRRIVFDDLNALERLKIYEKGVVPLGTEARTYGEFQFETREGDILSPHVEVTEPLKNQCQHYLSCIESESKPLTDAKAGLQVVQTLSAIDQSIAQNGAPVQIAPETSDSSSKHLDPQIALTL